MVKFIEKASCPKCPIETAMSETRKNTQVLDSSVKTVKVALNLRSNDTENKKFMYSVPVCGNILKS